MRSRTRRSVARKVALALIATGVLAVSAGMAPAGAATTSNLLYSVDGGSTWSSSVTAAPGQTVLVRQWFSNDGAANETNAKIGTTVPAGFTLAGGTTKVCLNPTTTNPTAPDSSEEVCADANEAAVWTGSTLQVSPSAGHYGEPATSTVGNLAFGRKRYLNLQQCQYQSTIPAWLSIMLPNTYGGTQFDGNTNVSNTAATAQSCGPVGPSYTFSSAQSGFAALPLLGRGYLNLHECSYRETGSNQFFSTWVTNPFGGSQYDAGTNTSNTSENFDDDLSCGAPITGWGYSSDQSGLASLPLNARYLTLHSCVYRNTTDSTWFTAVTPNADAGTGNDAHPSVGATPASPVCGDPATTFGWTLDTTLTRTEPLDLLDTQRSAGYVAYSITAPSSPSAASCAAGLPSSEAFTQNGSLISTPSGTKSSAGTVSVDWSQLSDPCSTTGTPMADPRVAVASVLALAGVGFVLHRRRSSVSAI